MIDKKYNRITGDIDNLYLSIYGEDSSFSKKYNGFVKCRLIHSKNDSLIFPDQIYIPKGGQEFYWIQPLTVLANLLIEDKENKVVHCMFHSDISAGNTLRVDFSNKDWVTNYDDDSSLFRCIINGPEALLDYVTGTGYFDKDTPFLKLYHHTLPNFKSIILKEGLLKTSRWNIQGTKTLNNIHYGYFTCLDCIRKPSDLKQIAMASEGHISLTLDNSNIPALVTAKDMETYKSSILNIPVYRENTLNRTATLEFVVAANILSPKHVWKHLPTNEFVFYEICMPFIYRVGMEPQSPICFSNMVIQKQNHTKKMNYQVVGVATSLKGLEAPFDEENTEHIFKIEPLNNDLNILDFWFTHTNSDQFSNKNIEMQVFESI